MGRVKWWSERQLRCELDFVRRGCGARAVNGLHVKSATNTTRPHIYKMTTRRIVNDEKTSLDYDGKGAPGPSNTSPAVPA